MTHDARGIEPNSRLASPKPRIREVRLTGNKGTSIHAELSNETNQRGQTKGVAEDNNGNIFKVSVYN